MNSPRISMLRSDPLRPQPPISDEESGWEKLEDAPAHMRADPGVRMDEENLDLVEAGSEVEDQIPHAVPAPPEPSSDEIARHNLTNYPSRSWCPHCLACRRPNSHHRISRRSSVRSIPLFCADYCFIKEYKDEDTATVLAGRLYPSMLVLATVVDSKGVSDENTIALLPAKKPTRFMTTSPKMAAALNKKCPGTHVHQHLIGGRCAGAAFCPLGLVRAIKHPKHCVSSGVPAQ